MTTASAAAELPPVSLRRGNPASPAGGIPDGGNRPVVKRDTVTSLSFGLPPAEELPVGEQVSLRRSTQAVPAVASVAPPAEEWRETAGFDLKQIGKKLGNWLDGFSRKKGVPTGGEVSPSLWSEAQKRLKNAPKQGWQILKEFVKSKHPYVSMGLGIAGTAALGIISPELAQKFIAHSGEIRTVAAMSALGLATIESVIDRETRFGRACKVARLIASDVALFSMVTPLGGSIGEWGHNIISNISISGAAAEQASTATATDVSGSVATVAPSETHTATATPSAEPSATPSATPDIQPTWEAGHPPSQAHLDWANNNSNVTESGGFIAYNLDSDSQPDAFVHKATGHIWWETPDGKWAVDSNPNDGVLKPDAVYTNPPVPDTSGSSPLHHLASPVHSGIREGELPLPEYKDINEDGKWDLFRMADGTWRLDADGSSYTLDRNHLPIVDQTKMLAEQQVQVNISVGDNGGVWDWTNAHVTTPDGTYEFKFDGTNWVQSDLLSPIERGVHDVNSDVTISAGQGKWHAGENYLNRILSSATSHDTDLVRNLSKGEGANTIAVDAVKDVLESHNVHTTVDGGGAFHVNVEPSYNSEIGARIQTTVDKINSWFTPGMDDAKKNEILAEMSKRGLIEVQNLTVEQLGDLSKLAAALARGG